MLSPLPRRSVWAYRFAHFIQTYQSSPIGLSGRPAHCPFRGLLGVHSRCGLHTRAVTNLRHANRRLQPLRYLHDCSDCFRLERLPGGACTHWEVPPLHGARQKPTLLSLGDSDKLVGSRGGVVGHLYNYFFLVVFLIGIAIVFLASEFGWRLGTRTEGQAASGNISALEQSLLGLLALIVGFTFLMALTRFEARREAVLNEPNAIGTTALRARLVPEPHRSESLKLLREYAQIRIDYIPTGKSFAELPTLIERSNNIQEALWQQVKALSVKDNNMVPTGLFIQALNEMIDNQGKRLSALRNYIPDVVLLSLFGIAAVA